MMLSSLRRAAAPLAFASLFSLAGAAGCGAGRGDPAGGRNAGQAGGGGGQAGGGQTQVAGTPVTVALSAEQQGEVARLRAALAAHDGLSADALVAGHAPPFAASLGYDPKKAAGLDLIQNSALKLDDKELTGLAARGFVISDRRRYPHFAYGYKEIYSQNLPVYISADAILEAVHQSYDEILKTLELAALRPELDKLLDAARGRLPGASLDAQTRVDADLFLTVAASLLRGEALEPAAGAKKADVTALLAKANAAAGIDERELFGAQRILDFSQFKPRGHYAGDPQLESYFRAMMWLGRIDLPLLKTEASGRQTLVRRSVAAAFALRSLMTDADVARWKSIDQTIGAFVGEPDSMGPLDVDRLKSALGLSGWDVSGVADDQLAGAIVAGAYGAQRILSQVVMAPPHDGTLPLDATFLFLGQRYVVDSHVFSNVVYDRVNPRDEAPRRMMPNPLDVAFAALGNDQAAKLVEADLRTHRHAPELAGMRTLVDEHGPAFWEANLYNLWLSSLRALSPNADLGDAASGLPQVARTEAWGRRLLSTQLASWAELRHDTILYVKQSYTGGVACEFPRAYVEPYPVFFARLAAFAQKGRAIAEALPFEASTAALGTQLVAYFARLEEIMRLLGAMAENQRQGRPHTAAQLAFINDAVNIHVIGCGGPAGIQGWYAELYFRPGDAATFAPTIADVHTQPTDETGVEVGRVLHVGTGWPRLMVVTANSCEGTRAYVGVVSTYHEEVTTGFERLNDQQWATRFGQNGPAFVPWMDDLVVR